MRWLIAEQSAYATTIAIAGGILRSLKTTKIGSKGLRSLVIQLKERPLERIASQIKLQPATEQIGNLPWQRGEPIAVELQRPEAGELGDLGGQRGEPVAFEHQPPEAGELADLGGQRGEPVGAEHQVPEVTAAASSWRRRSVAPAPPISRPGQAASPGRSRPPAHHRSCAKASLPPSIPSSRGLRRGRPRGQDGSGQRVTTTEDPIDWAYLANGFANTGCG